MRNHPSICEALWQKVLALGFTAESIKIKEEAPARSFQMQALDKKAAIRKAAVYAKEDEKKDAEAAGEQPPDPVSEKYWVMHEMGKGWFRDKLFPALEPRSFSRSNMRSMRLDPDHDGTLKDTLLEMLEYCTGLNRDVRLTGCFRNWNNVVEEAVEKYHDLGRRGLDLPLPPKWAEDGVYSVLAVQATSGVKIIHKLTKETADVPPQDCPSFDSQDQLTILDNYSEMSAALSSTKADCSKQFMLRNIFSVQIAKARNGIKAKSGPNAKRPASGMAQPVEPSKDEDMTPSPHAKRAKEELDFQGADAMTPAKVEQALPQPGLQKEGLEEIPVPTSFSWGAAPTDPPATVRVEQDGGVDESEAIPPPP